MVWFVRAPSLKVIGDAIIIAKYFILYEVDMIDERASKVNIKLRNSKKVSHRNMILKMRN